ncbi:MAG: glycosyltransferase family 2 protein [Candidatus Aenigmarchaeota archaeon]|nr:glycosyltransferase family 2 protein [Candidatus Aenigmarchaeota archaeon]
MKKSKVSIIIPTLNEERNLPIVLRDLKKLDFIDEIIIVDGYSKDNTVKIAKKFGCKIIYDNKGKGSALKVGMNAAKGDIVVDMDADCSMTANEILLLKAGIEAGYDVCMGSRFIQGGGTEDMPFLRKFGNKFFVFLVNLFWGMNYSDLCYGYRAFRKNIIKKLDLKRDGFGIETEMSIKAAKKGLRVLEVPSFEKARAFGKGNLRTFSDGWNILKTIIEELFE